MVDQIRVNPIKGRLSCCRVALVLIALTVALLWFSPGPILRGAAMLWVISDPVVPADAAVVLGGGLETRPYAAADLYRRGIVKQVLLSNVAENRLDKLEILPGHTELNRQVLLKLGVPSQAIVIFGDELSNTFQEARAAVIWTKENHIKSIIVPTELFGTRRVRWVFRHETGAAAIVVNILAVPSPNYTTANWWMNVYGVIDFQNEVLKYIYYRLRH
jgi:uncharacterized SAM-binding protein YcdF (DUF218 family)